MPHKYKPKPKSINKGTGTKKDMSQDKALVNLTKKVKKLEHSSELKYQDGFFTNTFDNDGIAFALSSLAQGDDYNQRIGEEVNAKYLNIHYRGIQAASSGTGNIRMVLFWDMQCNGLAPTFFTSVDRTEGVIDDMVITNRFIAPFNYRTKDRYKVLMDKKIAMNPHEPTLSQTLFINKSFNLGGARIKYADSGSTITSITSRSLYLLCIGSTGNTIGNNLGVRKWYTDA